MLRNSLPAIAFTRSISSTVHKPAELIIDKISCMKDDTPSESGSRVQFKLINDPPTVARLAISPRVPIYIRNGCLVSVYENSTAPGGSNISLTKKFLNLWSNLVNYRSLNASQFDRLVADKSLNALVSTNNSLNKNQQTILYHLNLDGKTDWQVWGKDSIVAFEQNSSLEIGSSKSMIKFNKFKNSNFTVLKGRGNVLINGVGSIVEIDLQNTYDEILINYRNILAINGKSQLDIKDAVSNQLLSSNKFKMEKILITSLLDNGRITLDSFNGFASSVSKVALQWMFKSYDTLKYGAPANFVKINGPRTVLMQSFNNAILDSNIKYEMEPLLEDTPAKEHVPEKVKDDINNSDLSIATVYSNRKVEFKKTLHFL